MSEHSLHSVLQTVADLTEQVMPGTVEISPRGLTASCVNCGSLVVADDRARRTAGKMATVASDVLVE